MKIFNDKTKLRESLTAYLFLAPFLGVFLVFLGYPVIYSLYLSLRATSFNTDWYNVFGSMKFVGLNNYQELLFNDPRFWWSLYRTLVYAALTIPTSIVIGLLLAMLLNNKLRARGFFRSSFYLPNVLDLYVIGTIWVLLFSPNYGLVDVVLNKLNITYFSTTGLLGNPWTALPAIAFVVVVKGAGFGMILFLAAIQNIPDSIYEAADIDGASWWEKLRYITLPLVKPVMLFMIITGTMNALNAFTEIYAMASTRYGYGGPFIEFGGRSVGSTSISGLYLYQLFERGEYGKAAALSYLLMLLAFIISFINMKWLKAEK
ncbi:MAG: sugar ABC transporter permease [Acidobacteriota bacterium]